MTVGPLLEPHVFDAFARSYEPPQWIIDKLVRQGSVRIRSALASAIDAVPKVAVDNLDAEARAQCEILYEHYEPEYRARLYLVARHAALEVQRARLREITQPRPYGRPLPCDHPALTNVPVDDEGMVPLAAFDINGDGLCINGYTFFVLPPVQGSNAAYWLLEEISRARIVGDVRVRLDPLLHGPVDELAGRFYKAAVWGRPLDWNRIRNLRGADHGQWVPGKLSRPFMTTEYAWLPRDEEVDFVCEELPLLDEVTERGARYLHGIYNKARHKLVHLDGAIRVYRVEELIARAKIHVRNAGKVGVRVKVFRTDSPIEPDALAAIAQGFFFWNYDVARYFGAAIHPDL